MAAHFANRLYHVRSLHLYVRDNTVALNVVFQLIYA